jgi:uncharacterized LabA/DUF88 family protein
LRTDLSTQSKRVVVFIDYQNVYMRAREAFHPTPTTDQKLPAFEGQIDPFKLGERIVTRATHETRHLHQVRVYRGQPDATRQPRAYGASSKQVNAWRQNSQTEVILRPLRYPYGWPTQKAEEKGVDVKLAVDFISMAINQMYDVGIIMSEDTDLVPALEAVFNLKQATGVHCEVATWQPLSGPRRGLKLSATKLWCHYLDVNEYRHVADSARYVE